MITRTHVKRPTAGARTQSQIPFLLKQPGSSINPPSISKSLYRENEEEQCETPQYLRRSLSIKLFESRNKWKKSFGVTFLFCNHEHASIAIASMNGLVRLAEPWLIILHSSDRQILFWFQVEQTWPGQPRLFHPFQMTIRPPVAQSLSRLNSILR